MEGKGEDIQDDKKGVNFVKNSTTFINGYSIVFSMAECKSCPECAGDNIIFNDKLMECVCKDCGLVFAPGYNVFEKIKKTFSRDKRVKKKLSRYSKRVKKRLGKKR